MTRPALELQAPTFAQLQTIRRMDNEGFGVDDIAAETRLHRDQVRAARKAGLPPIAQRKSPQAPYVSMLRAGPAVSNAQAHDRDARAFAAFRRGITAALMGDPPPGFSALDRAQPKNNNATKEAGET